MAAIKESSTQQLNKQNALNACPVTYTLDKIGGSIKVTTGSGDVRIAVHAGAAAELDVRSGSGRARSELTVSDTAPSGATTALHIHGRTGSGNVLVTRALSGAGAAG